MTITRYTFETGTDDTNILPGDTGTTTVSGSRPQWETAAAFASSLLGVECTGVQWAEWAAPASTWSGSVYLRCTVNPGTGSTRIVALNTATATIVAGLRFQATGAISIVDGGQVIVGAAFTTTWAAGDNFRFDWQVSNSGGVIFWQIRIFKGANINGTTPDESVSRSITGTAPTLIQIGSQSAGTWNVQFDNVALSNVAEWIGPYAINVAPVANAGPNQTVDALESVNLTAAASTDSDGTIVSYTWTQTAGFPDVELSGTGATRTFEAPAHLEGTVLTFEVEVVDDDGATDTDTVDITVNAAGTVISYDFESGTDGVALAALGGIVAVSVPNTPTYSSTADFHTSLLGVVAGPVDSTNQAWVGFGTVTNSAGSAYLRIVTESATLSNRVLTFQSGATNVAGIRQNIDGTWCIDAGGIQQGASSTVTWAVGDEFRIDWDVSYANSNLTVRAHFFKNGAIDDPTGDEDDELIRTFAVTATPGSVRIGARNIGWMIEFDDVSIANAVGFIGPNVPAVVADAGNDQSVAAADPVVLDATDSVGSIDTYTWTQISGSPIVTLGGSGAIRTFDAPYLLGGTELTFEVEVEDGVTTDIDEMVVVISSGDEFWYTSAGWIQGQTEYL